MKLREVGNEKKVSLQSKLGHVDRGAQCFQGQGGRQLTSTQTDETQA